MFIANLGDSRTVICSKGKAKALTKDHNTKDNKEIDRITKAGG
jgi:serine/threonine protein phosphatase PrpC